MVGMQLVMHCGVKKYTKIMLRNCFLNFNQDAEEDNIDSMNDLCSEDEYSDHSDDNES